MQPDIQWVWADWQQLTKEQLYDALALRAEVFVVEQTSYYCDPDGWDQQCLHLLGYAGDNLVAYARLFPPGVKRAEAVLGRLCTAATHRKLGLGDIMIAKRLEYIKQHWPDAAVWTQMQAYRLPVYLKLGFTAISKEYLEDQIPHIDMRLASIHDLKL